MSYNIEYYNNVMNQNRKLLVRENAMGRVIETFTVTSDTVKDVVKELKEKYENSCFVEFYY